MSQVQFFTITQQVANHLQAEIMRGRWMKTMPGRQVLAKELGVNHQTVVDALRLLEREGVLLPAGAGRCRRIVRQPRGTARQLRVALLLWSQADSSWTHVVELQHRLAEAGHVVVCAAKTLLELKMDVGRVARLVAKTKADAWVVLSGSREVLTWFAQQKFPTFAFYGGWRGIPIASFGLDSKTAMENATNNLLDLGHRRIVLLVRRLGRVPKLAPIVQTYIKTLETRGITRSPFSLPDWEENATGFQKCLEALFQITPPTAIIADEPEMFAATYHFLAARGLKVPEHVSLIYNAHEPVFDWCIPTVAHMCPDLRPLVGHILRWANNVRQGKRDLRQHLSIAKYIPGGTVAPPPRKPFAHKPSN